MVILFMVMIIYYEKKIISMLFCDVFFTPLQSCVVLLCIVSVGKIETLKLSYVNVIYDNITFVCG
jgi:hypothetical protein